MLPVLAAGIGLLVGVLGATAVFGSRVTALEVRAQRFTEDITRLDERVQQTEKDINGVAQIARRCSHREES